MELDAKFPGLQKKKAGLTLALAIGGWGPGSDLSGQILGNMLAVVRVIALSQKSGADMLRTLASQPCSPPREPVTISA